MNVVVEAVMRGVYAGYCYCSPLWCMYGVCTYHLYWWYNLVLHQHGISVNGVWAVKPKLHAPHVQLDYVMISNINQEWLTTDQD
jgi:hypothetical protein